VVVKWLANPYLVVLKTSDSLATVTDYSAAAQDNSTSSDVVLSSLPTAANGGYLYVGAYAPFRGVVVDVDSTNSTASVLTVNYWNGAWTSISATDGTASGGATFAVDGNVTWTVPSDWVAASLATINSPAPGAGVQYRADGRMYWTRWQVSVALDASTTLNSMLAMNRSTTYAELPSGVAWQQRMDKAPGGIGCIEALTDAGTANLVVLVGSFRDGLVG
jgi:hypothetical protein